MCLQLFSIVELENINVNDYEILFIDDNSEDGTEEILKEIDIPNKKIYCSRMMPMNGMGDMMPSSESTIIQALNYSYLLFYLSMDIFEYQLK